MTAKKILCPKCKSEVLENAEYKPFCSKRCRLIDLGAWASEKYSVPAQDQEAVEENNELKELADSDSD